jgi:hypothetical protein
MNPVYAPARIRPAIWFGVLLLLIIGVERAVTTLAVFSQQPMLPYAVAFDLLVGIPGLFYLLVVRPYKLPVSVLAVAVGACLALAYWVLPDAQQAPLQALYFLPTLLKAGTLLLLVSKGWQLLKWYRLAYRQQRHFWPSIQAALQQTLGPAGGYVVAEVKMLRYAFVGWWAKPETEPESIAFTSHRDSGFTGIAVVLVGVLVVEMAVMHVLANLWSARLAAWLLFFEVYTLVWLVAHAHAVRLRPTLLTQGGTLHLNVGFIWHLAVPLSEVAAIEPLRDTPKPASDLLNLTKLLFTPPNLLLTFNQPLTISGPYGIQQTGQQVAVYLDHPQGFVEAIKKR